MEKRLGRGLAALISEESQDGKAKEKVEKISLKDIVPNPFQPRKRFNPVKMEELVHSIEEKGIIQPILVRPSAKGYELIAGERRWRAAQELGLEEIPAIVREDIDDANSLEISIIENIQREELNPVEEALAFQELIARFKYTLDKVGQMVGKDKTTISNSLRLLSLPQAILSSVEEGTISTGHAKVLLSIQNEHKQKKIAKTIIEKQLSVRDTECLAHQVKGTTPKTRRIKTPEILQIEEDLQHRLGTKINIIQGKKRGRIEIQYFSNKDLDRLLKLLL
ncbi:MAG: ParB/RepB/Spo0J family partition protein [Candidatus Omnitrophota bacterium]